MNCTLSLNGNPKPLLDYLKNFQRISPSLTLEVDVPNSRFVAKVFAAVDGSFGRYSSISFADANITVKTTEDLPEDRIKVTVFNHLGTLIKMITSVSNMVDTDGNSHFDITITYKEMFNENGSDLLAECMVFSNEKAKLRFVGFRPSEVPYMADERFLAAFNVTNPISVELTPDTIESIIKLSDITKIDAAKDELIFYNEDSTLYVKDAVNANFTYKIGAIDNKYNYNINIPVFRDMFTTLFDKTNCSYNIIFGYAAVSPGMFDRIVFDSIAGDTKIIISAVQR